MTEDRGSPGQSEVEKENNKKEILLTYNMGRVKINKIKIRRRVLICDFTDKLHQIILY